MRIYHTRPIPFNILNEMEMRVILNKRDGVGMGVTRPEPAPIPTRPVGIPKCITYASGFFLFFFSLFNVIIFHFLHLINNIHFAFAWWDKHKQCITEFYPLLWKPNRNQSNRATGIHQINKYINTNNF